MKSSMYVASYILLCTVGKTTGFDVTPRSTNIKVHIAKRTKTQHALNVYDAHDFDKRKVSSFQVSISSTSETKDSEPKRVKDYSAIASSVFESDKRPVILFDGVCNLCNEGVNFALDYDKKANFRFASIQSKVGQSLMLFSGRDPNDMSSILVVQEDGSCLCESDAVLRIAQGLDGILFQSIVLVGQRLMPTSLRDALYHVVSHNRHRFGKRDSCRLDWDGEYENRFVKEPEES